MNKRIKRKRSSLVEQKPSLVAHYTEQAIGRITKMGDGLGFHAYRGQENACWPVKSAAYRRILSTLKSNGLVTPPKDLLDLSMFIRYHEIYLLEPARMDGYGIQDGRELHDLELLAKLQHLGAATCLVDFTTNFLAALWFACRDEEDTVENDGTKGNNGKVFILDINNDFRPLKQSDLGNEIRSIINTVKGPDSPSYWYWAPHGMNQRILKQDSLFVFGKMTIDNGHLEKPITVEKEHKKGLLKELEKLGVTRESLFKDFPGFASMNRHCDLISNLKMSALELYRAGKSAHNRRNMKMAISLYDDAASKGFTQKADLFIARGRANHDMEEYYAAIKDYNKVVEIDSSNFTVYYHRGITKLSMGCHAGAVNDFTKSLEFRNQVFENFNSENPNLVNIHWFRSSAYEKMGNTNKAISDLQEAIRWAKKYDYDEEVIHEIDSELIGLVMPPEYPHPHEELEPKDLNEEDYS